MQRAHNGDFFAVFAAPPCNSFSVSRFFTPKDRKPGPPPLRDRDHPLGLPHLAPRRVRQVRRANAIINRTAAILLASWQAGAEFIIENPPDRGMRDTPYYLHPRHCPLWNLPVITELTSLVGTELITFPQCAFGAPFQKYTSLLSSPGLAVALRPLGRLACNHAKHDEIAGGTRDDRGEFTSFRSTAYPLELNFLFARILASLAIAGPAQPTDAPGSAAPQPPPPPAAPSPVAEDPAELAPPPADTPIPPSPSPEPPSSSSPDSAGPNVSPVPSPPAKRPYQKVTYHRGSNYPKRERR